jgi:hypothetical protein
MAIDPKTREILRKEMPGWEVVEHPASPAPSAKPDAVAPPLWYAQYKAGKTPIPSSVTPGFYQIGSRYVLVENHKLVENGARKDVVFKDGFVWSGYVVPQSGRGIMITEGRMAWGQG